MNSTDHISSGERVVIDLDGTLYIGNTFTRFVTFCARRLPRALPALLFAVAARKLRLISHPEAKQQILKAVTPRLTPEMIAAFIDTLLPDLDTRVARLAPGNTLSTAAPALYAVPLGERLGFARVYATELGGAENSGAEKVRRLEADGFRFGPGCTVVTDHRSDLPLLRANAAGRNILVRASARTRAAIQAAGIENVEFK